VAFAVILQRVGVSLLDWLLRLDFLGYVKLFAQIGELDPAGLQLLRDGRDLGQ